MMDRLTVLLELREPREGLVYFRYSLDGAAAKMSRLECKKTDGLDVAVTVMYHT
jgi:hypothetical protein